MGAAHQAAKGGHFSTGWEQEAGGEKGDPSLTLLSLPCSNIIVFPRELQQALIPWQCPPCQQPQHSPEQLQSCHELVRFQLFRVRWSGGDMASGRDERKAEGLQGRACSPVESPAAWSHVMACHYTRRLRAFLVISLVVPPLLCPLHPRFLLLAARDITDAAFRGRQLRAEGTECSCWALSHGSPRAMTQSCSDAEEAPQPRVGTSSSEQAAAQKEGFAVSFL